MSKQDEKITKQSLANFIYNKENADASDTYQYIQGKLFTLIDGLFSDKQQREAVKDMARDSVLESLSNVMINSRERTATLIYEYFALKLPHKLDQQQSLPKWHTNMTSRGLDGISRPDDVKESFGYLFEDVE